ncbi:MAG: type II toxin-antitoxin system VapB family antitoxin [Fimbriimonadaceae bacterium]
MNIKNEEATRLAHELAAITGESITKAVTEALRERLERKKRDDEKLICKWMEISRESAARLKGKMIEIESLYDPETGLPI